MSSTRGLVVTGIAAATTGAALTFAFLPANPHISPPAHQFSSPPELPSSSKLLIPNINLPFATDSDVRGSPRCDYGPLWECIVNGNGGCEALEEDLRNCLDGAREPESVKDYHSQCDYSPLYECIVNGNGGCEALETELRKCLAKNKKKP